MARLGPGHLPLLLVHEFRSQASPPGEFLRRRGDQGARCTAGDVHVLLGHEHPIGARYKDGKASFTGEGFYVGYQQVSGDFTLTARIADITLSTEENGMHGGNWLGLYTSNVNKEREGHGFESTFDQWGLGIYLCNRHGIYKSTDGGRSYRTVYTCSH